MATQHPFERGADPLDRSPAPEVAGVGADRDALDLPHVERLPEQQELGLGVDRGALG